MTTLARAMSEDELLDAVVEFAEWNRSPTLAFAHYVWRPSDWLSGHIREVLTR